MHNLTRAALVQSIAHWDKNAQETSILNVSVGPVACALCHRFKPRCYIEDDHGGYEFCPVMVRTRRPGCAGSPYVAAELAHDEVNILIDLPFEEADVAGEEYDAAMERFRTAAREVANFLRSLLPKEG